MDSLILTLGHNSSAIAVRDGIILGGYETERFSGKKSDSAYPKEPIDELMKRFGLSKSSDVFIGHWFLNGELPEKSNKYLDYEHLFDTMPLANIQSLSRDFTHHDSHVESAQVFAGKFEDEYHAFVLDGFGTFGECISIYKVENGHRQLLNRWFGFEHSLGMFYQYATAYMGMKQHNHEYKILAYEVSAVEFRDPDDIIQYATIKGAERVKKLLEHNLNASLDPMLSIEALPRVQLAISDELDLFCEELDIDKEDDMFRPCVSLYVQTVVEYVVKSLVAYFNPKHLLLSGGLFYNVKVNSIVADMITGRTCIMPLAGDQGAGLGVYNHYKGDLIWPDHLNWGLRDLSFQSDVEGIIFCNTMEDALPVIEEELEYTGFVNLVRGAMEFGPRALCNTTTLALPLKDICEMINLVNDRTTEMPMAPVVSADVAKDVFIGLEKIHKSLEYMIVTRQYASTDDATAYYAGAAHYYADGQFYTGRPQITHDRDLVRLMDSVDEYHLLINTSFNYHGVPIVMTKEQIENTHKKQRANNQGLDIKTIIVRN